MFQFTLRSICLIRTLNEYVSNLLSTNSKLIMILFGNREQQSAANNYTFLPTPFWLVDKTHRNIFFEKLQFIKDVTNSCLWP